MMSTATLVRSLEDDVPRIIPRAESDNSIDLYGSVPSEVTLGQPDDGDRGVDSLDRGSGEQDEEEKRPAAEKGSEDGGQGKVQQPVSFFDQRLSKVRSAASVRWIKTSEQSCGSFDTQLYADYI